LHEAERRDTVRRIARAGDPDRALAALFGPHEARDDLFALYALNVELARIAEQAKEPDLGAIRL
jgi:15-cis-phytoene synthase